MGMRSFPSFTLRRLYGFSLILNNAWSGDGLNRWLKLITIVNCWWYYCMTVCSINTYKEYKYMLP